MGAARVSGASCKQKRLRRFGRKARVPQPTFSPRVRKLQPIHAKRCNKRRRTTANLGSDTESVKSSISGPSGDVELDVAIEVVSEVIAVTEARNPTRRGPLRPLTAKKTMTHKAAAKSVETL